MSISANFPNVKPSLLLDFANAQQLPPSVTFTRATTAAYYNGSTTAMAEQNLILQSQTIGAGWVINATYATDVGVAPDGTTTADQLTLASGKSCYQTVTWPSGTFGTVTVYVKAAATSSAAFFKFATNNTASWNTGLQSPKVALTSSWQRVTLSGILQNGGGGVNIHIDGSNTADGVVDPDCYGNVLVWGVQINTYTTATAYIATTTQTITNYVPQLLTAGGGQPRFDHNPTTSESLGLLIEEQRTNTVLASEQFGNATYWGSGGGSVTSNSIVAPNGTLTGDTLVSAASGLGASGVYQSVTGLSSASTYTLSCYVKANGSSWVQLIATSTGGSASPTRGWFNLSTGVIGSVNNTSSSLTIASVGNGWYRCSMILPALTSTGTTIYITCSNGDGIDEFTNNGFSGLFLWGAQVELGSFATSYIPTTTAAATRAADLASMTGANFSSWFNNAQGTFYAQANLSDGGRYFNTYKSSSSLQIEGVQGPTYYESFVYDGAVQAQIQITAAKFTSHRVATAYAVNDIAGCVDAGTVGTDTTAVLPIGLDTLNINAYTNGGPYGSGTIKKIAYYPLRLTNAQLQALTS